MILFFYNIINAPPLLVPPQGAPVLVFVGKVPPPGISGARISKISVLITFNKRSENSKQTVYLYSIFTYSIVVVIKKKGARNGREKRRTFWSSGSW